jgi:hypothetical protein
MIASRHGVTDLKVRAEADRPREDVLVVSVGKGQGREIFATRPADEAATLFGLVLMHLDQWLLSRKTAIVRRPAINPYGILWDADRMRHVSDAVMRETLGKAGRRTV